MTKEPYFIRVTRQSPTEFWINNPTLDHADWALANGATGCTNNPSYSQKMVDHPVQGPPARELLKQATAEGHSADEVAAIFQPKGSPLPSKSASGMLAIIPTCGQLLFVRSVSFPLPAPTGLSCRW